MPASDYDNVGQPRKASIPPDHPACLDETPAAEDNPPLRMSSGDQVTSSGSSLRQQYPTAPGDTPVFSARHLLARAVQRFTAHPALDVLALVVLTLLVWGLYPFSRGVRFFGDDINFLFEAWKNASAPLLEQVLTKYPRDGFTRVLAFWPFVLAALTPRPIAVLQLFYAGAWLLNGLAVAYVAKVIRPGSRLVPFAAGVLTVTATSDFLTASVVYGPHLLGIALFFLGTAGLLRSVEPGRGSAPAVAGGLLLLWSFFTVEYTYPAVPVVPVLIWLHARSARSARRWGHVARACWKPFLALALAFAPAVMVLMFDLHRPGSRAATLLISGCALPPFCPFPQWFWQFTSHVAHNFWPLAWAFRPIPPWYDNYPRMFTPLLSAVVAAFGTALALWRFRGHRRRSAAEGQASMGSQVALAIAALAAMALANAAAVNFGGDYFVRSHFVSRCWASLALALLLGVLARDRGVWLLSGPVFAGFVFFGIWGGIERQGYLLAYAVNERRELASLLEVVPGFAPPAQLLVIQPPGSPTFLASNNPNTVPFAYGDVALWHHRLIAPNSGFEYSRIDGDPSGRIRVIVNSKEELEVDPSRCVMVFYSISQRRFIRLDEIPAGLPRAAASAFDTYRPRRWVRYHQPGSTPHAIAEFAYASEGRLASRALGQSARYAKLVARTPSASMLSIAPSLADRIQVDSLTPYVVESSGARPFVWLGAGRAEGYSSVLWSWEAAAATLAIRVTPGPSRRDPTRHLVARLTGSGEAEQRFNRQFDHEGEIAIDLLLAAGANILETWIDDAADAGVEPGGDRRNLLARIETMHLASESRAPR